MSDHTGLLKSYKHVCRLLTVINELDWINIGLLNQCGSRSFPWSVVKTTFIEFNIKFIDV